jgi:hypothetical protein
MKSTDWMKKAKDKVKNIINPKATRSRTSSPIATPLVPTSTQASSTQTPPRSITPTAPTTLAVVSGEASPSQPPSTQTQSQVLTSTTPISTKVKFDATIDTVVQTISQGLKVATAATAVFPPAQSVIGGVSGAVDLVRVSSTPSIYSTTCIHISMVSGRSSK